jgi:hypothetical protein
MVIQQHPSNPTGKMRAKKRLPAHSSFSYNVCFTRSLQKIKDAFYLGLERLIRNIINMKQISLAIAAIIFMIYLGYDGMSNQSASGPFFMFIGICTSIGLTLDIVNMIRQWIRKSNLRKLGIQK